MCQAALFLYGSIPISDLCQGILANHASTILMWKEAEMWVGGEETSGRVKRKICKWTRGSINWIRIKRDTRTWTAEPIHFQIHKEKMWMKKKWNNEY